MERRTRIRIAAVTTVAVLGGLSVAGLATRAGNDESVRASSAQAVAPAAPANVEPVGTTRPAVVTVPGYAAESPVEDAEDQPGEEDRMDGEDD